MCNDQLFTQAVAQIQETERQKVFEAMSEQCRHYNGLGACLYYDKQSICTDSHCPFLNGEE